MVSATSTAIAACSFLSAGADDRSFWAFVNDSLAADTSRSSKKWASSAKTCTDESSFTHSYNTFKNRFS